MAEPSAFFIDKLATVICNFVREHGAPNGVSPSELAQRFNAISEDACRMTIGKAVRWHRQRLNELLADCRTRIVAYERAGRQMVIRLDVIA